MTDTLQELTEARINIARLESEVSHLNAGMAEVRISQVAMLAKLDAMQLTMSEARGGYKTLMLVGGAAGAIGSGLAWLAMHTPKVFQ